MAPSSCSSPRRPRSPAAPGGLTRAWHGTGGDHRQDATLRPRPGGIAPAAARPSCHGRAHRQRRASMRDPGDVPTCKARASRRQAKNALHLKALCIITRRFKSRPQCQGQLPSSGPVSCHKHLRQFSAPAPRQQVARDRGRDRSPDCPHAHVREACRGDPLLAGWGARGRAAVFRDRGGWQLRLRHGDDHGGAG
jgi:hypothetical protein